VALLFDRDGVGFRSSPASGKWQSFLHSSTPNTCSLPRTLLASSGLSILLVPNPRDFANPRCPCHNGSHRIANISPNFRGAKRHRTTDREFTIARTQSQPNSVMTRVQKEPSNWKCVRCAVSSCRGPSATIRVRVERPRRCNRLRPSLASRRAATSGASTKEEKQTTHNPPPGGSLYHSSADVVPDRKSCASSLPPVASERLTSSRNGHDWPPHQQHPVP